MNLPEDGQQLTEDRGQWTVSEGSVRDGEFLDVGSLNGIRPPVRKLRQTGFVVSASDAPPFPPRLRHGALRPKQRAKGLRLRAGSHEEIANYVARFRACSESPVQATWSVDRARDVFQGGLRLRDQATHLQEAVHHARIADVTPAACNRSAYAGLRRAERRVQQR